MRKIRIGNRDFNIPVVVLMSTCTGLEHQDAMYATFFEAVEQSYGVGWGRKGAEEVDSIKNFRIDGDPFVFVHPVGKAFCKQYDEIVATKGKNCPWINKHFINLNSKNIEEDAGCSFSQSAFPLPYYWEYCPRDVSDDETPDARWSAMSYLLAKCHKEYPWIDAFYIDAVKDHHKNVLWSDPRELDKVATGIFAKLPVTFFYSPQHLIDQLTRDQSFLGVKECL